MKKSYKQLMITLSVLILLSCSSSTERIHYYSLALESKTHLPANNFQKKKLFIVMEPVQLARFLKQPGLVLQKGENELITANYNRWAEPLDELIQRQLLTTLNNKSQKFHFELTDSFFNNPVDIRLRIFFDKFHATDQSMVIISGRYQITDLSINMQPITEFSIEKKQSANGYLNTVIKLKIALNTLADDILSTLNNLNFNTV